MDIIFKMLAKMTRFIYVDTILCQRESSGATLVIQLCACAHAISDLNSVNASIVKF